MSQPFECGICWWVYDPRAGDELREIAPGTGFDALPADWRCPRCDAERERFLPLGAETPAALALEQAYRAIVPRMRELPGFNPAVDVEAVGFASFESGQLGILITPWFMNLVYAPDASAACLELGQKRTILLPAGEVELMGARVEGAPGFEVCPLFSPLPEFPGRAAARATAQKTLELLFTRPEPEASEE